MTTTSKKIVKVQVPMDQAVHDLLTKRAISLGFDSLQAYIRFWAKAQVDNRSVDFGDDTWGQPSQEAADRINKLGEEAAKGINLSKSFSSTQAALKHLRSL